MEFPIFLIYVVSYAMALQIVNNPGPIVVPINDRVSFDCSFHLKPDRFEWLHLKKWPHSLAEAEVMDHKRYENRENSTNLSFKVDTKSKTGGYQCVAWYGAEAIASIPALLTIADLANFPIVPSSSIHVTTGNKVTLYCPAPASNPPAVMRYFKREGKEEKEVQGIETPSRSIVLQNVTVPDSGEYFCRATNWITDTSVDAPFKISVNVSPPRYKEAPKFLRVPPKNYTVALGDSIVLECLAIGTPPPVVTWRPLDGPLPIDRYEYTPVGLKISQVKRSDQGVYVCEYNNGVMPPLQHYVTLGVHEMPEIITGPHEATVTEGDSLVFNCTVKGVPEPKISWVINSRSVFNDTNIEDLGTSMYITEVEKRHAGAVQCFATNPAGTVFSTAKLKVYPKQITGGDLDDSRNSNLTPPPANSRRGNNRNNQPSKSHPNRRIKNRQKNRNLKMVPPSKPNITRLSDTSVMVRWNVPENDGMDIRLFKVQYREVSSNDPERYDRAKNSKWDTVSDDIGPKVNTYEVDNLYTDSVYKFRIAAIYSNNDNKLGPNSAKFHLQRGPFLGSNKLPTPNLTFTEAINETTIKIYWDLPNKGNATIEGFYVNYRDVNLVNEYIKDTVDNASARSHVISYLIPGARYEFKLQSFNAGSGSDFSAILSQETLSVVTEIADTNDVQVYSNKLQIYIIIGAAVGGIALLTGTIFALIMCKRYRQKKAQDLTTQGDGEDKRNSIDAHHIQAESKDYSKNVIGRRTMHNGCAPPGPKLTITPNPLAAATDEDKNQNVMEMSFISSNNNCDPSPNVGGSSSRQETEVLSTDLKKVKSGKISNSNNITATTTAGSRIGENYV